MDIGGGVTSVYVRLCPVLFGFYETTDVVFGTLADIDGHWRTWTDISGLGRTMADLDGHWQTRTDIGGLRRTLEDSDGLVLQRGGLPSEIALPGGTSSPKLCIEARGRCALRNWDSDICPTHVPKKTTSVRNFDIISIQRSSN